MVLQLKMWITVVYVKNNDYIKRKENRKNKKTYKALYINREVVTNRESASDLKLQSGFCIFCPRKYVKYIVRFIPQRNDGPQRKDSFRKRHYRYISLSVSSAILDRIPYHSPCRPWSKRILDWNFRIEVFIFTRD